MSTILAVWLFTILTWLPGLSVLSHSTDSVQSEARSSTTSDDWFRDKRPAIACTSRELTKLKLITMLPYPDNVLPRQFRPSLDLGDEILLAIEMASTTDQIFFPAISWSWSMLIVDVILSPRQAWELWTAYLKRALENRNFHILRIHNHWCDWTGLHDFNSADVSYY